jgi:hypothetical protein
MNISLYSPISQFWFFLLLALPLQAAPKRLPYLDIYPFNRIMTQSDLRGTTSSQRRLMRNAIFARKGRPFKDVELARYFKSKKWYRPDPNWRPADDDRKLSALEKRNAEFLLKSQDGQSKASTRTPGSNARAEAQFLKVVQSGATLAQIKKLLPKSTRYSRAQWNDSEHFYGNWITFRGPVSGHLMFATPAQRKARTSGGSPSQKFNASDPINWIAVIMDNGRQQKSEGDKKRIAALSRVLGKATNAEYSQHVDPIWAEGYSAVWESKNRTIYYNPIVSFGFDEHQDDAVPILRLFFPYSVT